MNNQNIDNTQNSRQYPTNPLFQNISSKQNSGQKLQNNVQSYPQTNGPQYYQQNQQKSVQQYPQNSGQQYYKQNQQKSVQQYPQTNVQKNVQQYPHNSGQQYYKQNQQTNVQKYKQNSGQLYQQPNYQQKYPQNNVQNYQQPSYQQQYYQHNSSQQYQQQYHQQKNYHQNIYQQNYYQVPQQSPQYNQQYYHQNSKYNQQYSLQHNPPPQNPEYGNKSVQNSYTQFFNKYDIFNYYHSDLKTLNKFDIVIIGDDSGSMGTRNKHSSKTRWDELKETIQMVIELGSMLDTDGIDLYFLNRRGAKNVTSFAQVSHLFDKRPSGGTPLSKVIEKVLRRQGAKPLLLVIATDGKPRDLYRFTNTLRNRDYNRVFVSILACSDNKNDIGYLNKLDKDIPKLDVLDDYHSEKKEVQSKQGYNFPYSFGDHIARLLLGPVYPKYDRLDEYKIQPNYY